MLSSCGFVVVVTLLGALRLLDLQAYADGLSKIKVHQGTSIVQSP